MRREARRKNVRKEVELEEEDVEKDKVEEKEEDKQKEEEVDGVRERYTSRRSLTCLFGSVILDSSGSFYRILIILWQLANCYLSSYRDV